MEETKTTALYCRVARKDNERIKQQESQLLQYATKQGHTNLSVYIDNGESGLDYNRPGFMKMNEDIDNGKINVVIIQSINRIGRNYITTAEWINKMTEKGIAVKSVDGSVENSKNVLNTIFNEYLQNSKNSTKKGGVQYAQ